MYRFSKFLLAAAAFSTSLLVCFYVSGRDYYSLREIVLPSSRMDTFSLHDDDTTATTTTTAANGKSKQDVLLGPPLAAVRPPDDDDISRKLAALHHLLPDTTSRLFGLPLHLPLPTTISPSSSSSSSSLMVVNAPTAAPQAVLVISTTKENDMTWLYDELGDLLQPPPPTTTTTTTTTTTATTEHSYFSAEIYVTNNLSAPLHTPANKGHEAMAYLSYIIDRYDSLPPISIFLHGHLLAWHNNIMLHSNTSSMLRHLRLDKIHQDGYFNLRCHFNPGCPEHLFPFATVPNLEKSEEVFVKDAWKQVFGRGGGGGGGGGGGAVNDDDDAEAEAQIPHVLAQACCSQFAVTATRIRAVSLSQYVHFRNWILETGLTDYMSGRIFEYFWQWIFNGTAVFCPDPRVCYCEGYGICFEGPEEYDAWMKLKELWDGYEKELRVWGEWREEREKNNEKGEGKGQEGGGGGGGDYDGDDHTMENPSPPPPFSTPPPPPPPPPPSQISHPEPPSQEAKAPNAPHPLLPLPPPPPPLPPPPPPHQERESPSQEQEPPLDLDIWLISQMNSIQAELDRRIAHAMAIGADPERRIAAVRASKELPASEKGESWS